LTPSRGILGSAETAADAASIGESDPLAAMAGTVPRPASPNPSTLARVTPREASSPLSRGLMYQRPSVFFAISVRPDWFWPRSARKKVCSYFFVVLAASNPARMMPFVFKGSTEIRNSPESRVTVARSSEIGVTRGWTPVTETSMPSIESSEPAASLPEATLALPEAALTASAILKSAYFLRKASFTLTTASRSRGVTIRNAPTRSLFETDSIILPAACSGESAPPRIRFRAISPPVTTRATNSAVDPARISTLRDGPLRPVVIPTPATGVASAGGGGGATCEGSGSVGGWTTGTPLVPTSNIAVSTATTGAPHPEQNWVPTTTGFPQPLQKFTE